MKLQFKIIAMPIVVMITIFVISMVGMEFHLKETLQEQLEQKLRIFASFSLSSVIEVPDKINVLTPSIPLAKIAKRISRISSSRITYLNVKGEVLADSAINYAKIANIKNHMNRLEVSLALKNNEGIA